MSTLAEDIKSLTAPEKAELYYLLGQDEALNHYIFSNKELFAELQERDNAIANGSMKLLTRQELTNMLNKRRNGI